MMKFANKSVDLTTPRIMGILNVTPDSFSDGGQFHVRDNALRHAENMIQNGADFIDVGGESTKPGACEVSIDEELERTVPIIDAINKNFDTVISIDSSKALVMKEAVKAGAGLINDVRALQEPDALKTAAELVHNNNIAVCLMHMQGTPSMMQHSPEYRDVIKEVSIFLSERKSACLSQGIKAEQILLDPGFGFGKSLEHNYQLLAQLGQLSPLNSHLLVGVSRKSMIGNLIHRDVNERLAGSLTCAIFAVMQGAKIIRVHDVKESVDAIKTMNKIIEYG